MEDEVRKGKYQHYKGDFYEVIDFAKHSETLEEVVIYRSLKNGSLWVRPKKMFLEKILIEGKEIFRFNFVKD